MMRGVSLVLAALVLAQAGCESPTQEMACPGMILPAFRISVSEASTLDPINGALVWTRTGARTDTLGVADNQAVGPLGVSGTFDVSVTKAGYSDWFRENVLVEQGPCGPNTVSLDVFLEQ